MLGLDKLKNALLKGPVDLFSKARYFNYSKVPAEVYRKGDRTFIKVEFNGKQVDFNLDRKGGSYKLVFKPKDMIKFSAKVQDENE
jgi:hypothetical protein